MTTTGNPDRDEKGHLLQAQEQNATGFIEGIASLHLMLRLVLICALAAGVRAFVPSTTGAALRVSRGVTARRPIVLSAEGDDEVYDDAPVVSYLTSEATTAPDVPEKKGWELADEYRAGTSQPAVNAGPTNYDGFVDSEGFDGGDGQVGVVGDGETSNLENFDNSQVRGAR